jgi:Taurine catabolism dioxygenase TauD, TfdA family
LIWRNPANARDALYIASHAGAIEEMDDARSRALIARLIDEASQSAHVYSHQWRTGDVILWDNRATMHRGRPWPWTQARLMVRTTISARDVNGLDPTELITHPVTFAFVADRNPLTPTSTARSATTANAEVDLRPECANSSHSSTA